MEKKTHILIISSWYPTSEKPFLGNFVQRQAKLLSNNFKVTVLNTVSDSSVDKIEVEQNQSNDLLEITLRHPKSKSFFQKRKDQLTTFIHGLALVKDVDLIIGNIALPKSWQFIEAKKKFNCPLLYIEHGSYFRPEKKSKWTIVEKYLLWKLKKYLTEVIAVSAFLKKDMADVFGKFDIKVIGNHVDDKLFTQSPKQDNTTTEFLHISTLDKHTKNPEGIIHACALLKRSGFRFHLTIVSDEDMRSCKELALAEKVFEEIDFIGPLKWEETAAHYHKSDAFILFSNYETFSIVLAEALMTGTPSITTPVGIAYEKNPVTGINIEINNTDSLKDAMVDIIEKKHEFKPDEIRKLGMLNSSANVLNQWTKIIEEHVG